jgi:hypothetical protein
MLRRGRIMTKRRTYRLRPGEAAMLMSVPREPPGVVGGGVELGDVMRHSEFDEFNSLPCTPSEVDRSSLEPNAVRPPRLGICPQCGLGRDECWSSFMQWIEQNQRKSLAELAAAGWKWWSAEEAEMRIRAKQSAGRCAF